MKFYYNGELIRTSKTHNYTHALLSASGKTVCCSATKAKCEKELSRLINERKVAIENDKRIIQALKIGEKGYTAAGRRGAYVRFNDPTFWTVENFEENLKLDEKQLKNLENYKVVELEARA